MEKESMNLREEIGEIIGSTCEYGIEYCGDCRKKRDMIVAEIEKRIDEMINEVMKKNGSEITQNGNRLDFRIIYDDQIATLKQVKEMLK